MLNNILDALKLYGFVILDSDNTDLINTVKQLGALQYLRVRRLNNYIILEIGYDECEKECGFNCKDNNSSKNIGDCYGKCRDECITERLKRITEVVSRNMI